MIYQKKQERDKFKIISLLLLTGLIIPVQGMFDTDSAQTLIKTTGVIIGAGAALYGGVKLYLHCAFQNAQKRLEKNKKISFCIIQKQIHNRPLTPDQDEYLATTYYNNENEYKAWINETKTDHDTLLNIQTRTNKDIKRWQNTSKAQEFIKKATPFSEENQYRAQRLQNRLTFLKERKALIGVANLIQTEKQTPFYLIIQDGHHHGIHIDSTLRKKYPTCDKPRIKAHKDIEKRKAQYQALVGKLNNFNQKSKYSNLCQKQSEHTIKNYEATQQILVNSHSP